MVSAVAWRIRVTAGVNDQRDLRLRQFRWRYGGDADAAGDGAPPREWLGDQRPPPGALQQQAGQQPEHARAEHDDLVAIAVPGVERHLQGRLDQGEQSRGGGIDGGQRNQVSGLRREHVLVRMEREDPLARLRHVADAGVSIGEGVGEGAAERVDRVVQRQVGRDLAAIHQPFGAAADAGAQGADEDLAGGRPSVRAPPDLHTTRGGMEQRAGRIGPPRCRGVKKTRLQVPTIPSGPPRMSPP